MKLDRILMPTDFSECAKAALDYALVLAKRYDAELHLLHVIALRDDPPAHAPTSFPSNDDLGAQLEAIAQGEMSRLLESHSDSPRIRRTKIRATAAAPAIVDYAQRKDIDLVVIGTHGHRGLRRWLVGSVTEEVVRTASCPVLTIRNASDARQLRELERVVVPYDFSSASVQSFEVATRIAHEYGSCIDVVHVMAPELTPGGVLGAPLIRDAPDLTKDLEARLDRSLTDSGASEASDCSIETHVLTGPIAWSLVDFAQASDAGLIVIATEGLSGLRHLLIGSVTERIVRVSTCPVLVLRGAKEASSAVES